MPFIHFSLINLCADKLYGNDFLFKSFVPDKCHKIDIVELKKKLNCVFGTHHCSHSVHPLILLSLFLLLLLLSLTCLLLSPIILSPSFSLCSSAPRRSAPVLWRRAKVSTLNNKVDARKEKDSLGKRYIVSSFKYIFFFFKERKIYREILKWYSIKQTVDTYKYIYTHI